MGEARPKCPSCGFELERMPKARRKCPECREWILLKTHPHTREKMLCSAETAKEIDAVSQERADREQRARDIEVFSSVGIDSIDIAKARKGWFKMRTQVEAIAYLLKKAAKNRQVTRHDLSNCYWNLALMACKSGESSAEYQRESHRQHLFRMLKDGATMARVVSCGRACDHCVNQAGTVSKIREIVSDDMLPHLGCEFAISGERRGMCFCQYEAVWDDELTLVVEPIVKTKSKRAAKIAMFQQHLQSYLDSGANWVQIVNCPNACERCKVLGAKPPMRITQAMKMKPLPHRACNHLGVEDGEGTNCRCYYEQLWDDEVT